MKNRYLAAFKESGNILGLATFTAISAALLSPVPLAIGLALELVYLAFVPDLKWYQARLSKLFDADVEKRRQEAKAKVLPYLRPEMQDRFTRLEDVRREIDRQSSPDAEWFREILRKLDFLLEKFLQFSSKEAQFRAYLLSVVDEIRREKQDSPGRMRMMKRPVDTSGARQLKGRRGLADSLTPQAPHNRTNRMNDSAPSSPAQPSAVPLSALDPEDRWVQAAVLEVQSAYDEDLTGIRALCDSEPDDGTKAVLEKRIEVLSRRREFVGKIGRIMTNLNHQLNLLEDTFGLISDEIRARPPEQVLADIEDVVSQTNTMTQTLEEMAPFDQMLERISA